MLKNLLVVLFISSALLVGCGKKEEAPKTDNKTSQNTTSKTDTTKKTDSQKIKKSDAPKKNETQQIADEWIDITSPDGKLTFKLPGKWEAESSKSNGMDSFVATSPDGTMGFVAIAFPNQDVTADELLDAQVASFDFEPEGEAFAVETDNIDGWVVAASGNVSGNNMMMYMLSLIDKNSPGNYLVYIYTTPENFNANSAELEKILYSVDIKG